MAEGLIVGSDGLSSVEFFSLFSCFSSSRKIVQLVALLTFSYLHARKRLRYGNRPLIYHAWMIPYVCH
jgi:hypothetical protein